MANLKKEGLGIAGLGGENRIKVEISIESEPYQALLEALKKDAELTEKYGGRTVEGIEGVRAAVSRVDDFAKETLQKNKSN